ncbi:MAG: hypothetical protein IJT91_06490 [Clostridia bacterium]|nr:hypothetical protein [Clostridia bacterium]
MKLSPSAKKLLALLLCLLAVSAAITGCSKSGKSGGVKDSDTAASESNSDFKPEDYIAPAEFKDIDRKKGDPSDDEMQFSFDAEGKITQCTYKIDGDPAFATYTYENGYVHIISFMNGYVVDDKYITLEGEFDPDIGYSVVDGYYIKGWDPGENK